MKTILLLGMLISISVKAQTIEIRLTSFDPSIILYDGVRVDYGNYSNNIDNWDAKKLGGDGWRTSLGILRNGVQYSVERRDSAYTSDTIFLLVRNTRDFGMMLNISVFDNGNNVIKVLDSVTGVPGSIVGNFDYTFYGTDNNLHRFAIVMTKPVLRSGEQYVFYVRHKIQYKSKSSTRDLYI